MWTHVETSFEILQLVTDRSKADAGKECHEKQDQGDGARAWSPASKSRHVASIDGWKYPGRNKK